MWPQARNWSFASNITEEGHEHYKFLVAIDVLSDGSVKPCMLCQIYNSWEASFVEVSLTAWLPAGCQHQARLLHHSTWRGAPEAAEG